MVSPLPDTAVAGWMENGMAGDTSWAGDQAAWAAGTLDATTATKATTAPMPLVVERSRVRARRWQTIPMPDDTPPICDFYRGREHNSGKSHRQVLRSK